MCHPGYSDGALEDTGTRLCDQREQELHALLDGDVRNALLRLSIQLVSYRELG
jgi:predicted glycoside hydrolase/deacetylase ChbG (UPF0249 family)